MNGYRKSSQPLLPKQHTPPPRGSYDIYPTHPLPAGQITHGFDVLADRLAWQQGIVIDGMVGVLWDHLRAHLDEALHRRGIAARWVSVDEALRPSEQIDHLVAPYLGGDDPIFGMRFEGTLSDFFDPQRLPLTTALDAPIITYGTGAALINDDAYLVYVDVPKNEIQYRARAGSIHNVGATGPDDPGVMYKRFYFVDWVVLGDHAATILPRVDLYVDGQDADTPALIGGPDLWEVLTRISRTWCRVRPWFEPGPWGGQWMKERIPGLAQDVPNYAWSFEMIAPEQGIILESGGSLLEVSFDLLMRHNRAAILGSHAERFGREFPIRFDFLDTFGGGNLSLQCHPRPSYIRQHFGERFTQDETYYILDCKPGARVYLGFQDDIDAGQFRAALEDSIDNGTPVDVEHFVQTQPAEKHRLFLIPGGTIHCSGADNMVLEISATPYIFTFKMYDWLRLDLQGKPRPLNIPRAFNNLYFERRGSVVKRELVSQPVLIEAGSDWQMLHLPTHRAHFYDVHRIEFETAVTIRTDDSPHLLLLVEGESLLLETHEGQRQRFNYAETFMVPAAAQSYSLINEGGAPIKVVKAFLKAGWTEPEE